MIETPKKPPLRGFLFCGYLWERFLRARRIDVHDDLLRGEEAGAKEHVQVLKGGGTMSL